MVLSKKENNYLNLMLFRKIENGTLTVVYPVSFQGGWGGGGLRPSPYKGSALKPMEPSAVLDPSPKQLVPIRLHYSGYATDENTIFTH